MRRIPTLVSAGSTAAIVLTVVACGGPAPHGPAYVAPASASPNPAITSESGVTTPSDAFGPDCGQLPRGSAPGSVTAMSTQPAAAATATDPLLSTLASAFDKAGMADTLNHQKELTVFAPTNDAFTNLRNRMGAAQFTTLLADRDALAKILNYHVVVRRYDRAGLLNAGTVTSLQGASLRIESVGGSLTVSDNTQQTAHVLCGNLPTANATVFIVDTVLMPVYPGSH
jgi:uncharacterized surface protein with fasciclin (FAS1) repeats